MSILCLHGYLQSGDIMRKAIHRILPQADLVSPNGLFNVEIDDKSGFGWWPITNKYDLMEPPSEEAILECLEYGRKIAKEHEPIEIVIGFSQGASCATLWIQEEIIKPQKVVLISNFALKKYIHKINPIPSLHIYGEKDTLLQENFPNMDFKKYSLYSYYHEGKIYSHRWGHVIPSDSTSKQVIREFLS